MLGKEKEQLWAQQPKKEEQQSKPEGKSKHKAELNRGENKNNIRFDQQNKSWFGEGGTHKRNINFEDWSRKKEKR